MCGTDKYFWRQMFILSPEILAAFSAGLVAGYPSIIMQGLMAPDSDIKATESDISWIISCIGFVCFFSFFYQSFFLSKLGRKAAQISVGAGLLIGWIMITFAQNVHTIIAARTIQGMTFGYVNIVIIGEYCHPKRRGYFVTLRELTQTTGVLVAHLMTLYASWRQVAMFSTIPSVIAMLLPLFWPESPAFLAFKGKFEECKDSFHWINGDSIEREKELNDLLSSQMNRLDEKKRNKFSNLKMFVLRFSKQDFRKGVLIFIMVAVLLTAGGKFYFDAYIVDIISKIIEDKTVGVYFSVIADAMMIIAQILSCVLVKRFDRRTLLFYLGGLAVALNFCVPIIEVLSEKLESNFGWVSSWIIISINFVNYLGVNPICCVLFSEIMPLEHKVFGIVVSSTLLPLFIFISLKLMPVMLTNLAVKGTFAVYGVVLMLTLIILFYLLPETKNRTLQDIEHEMKGIEANETREQLLAPRQ